MVDKPAGWTSFDVVNYIRSKAAQAEHVPARKLRVGHTGTLDPFATGLLIILVGRNYTSRAGQLSVDKSYVAEICLDKTSSTGDPEGDISQIEAGQPPSASAVRDCLKSFIKTYMQTPPVFSALKVGGIRSYRLARSDRTVKLQPRPVTIYSARLLEYDYPLIKFSARVSSGTYIRTLAEDIGKALGRTAYTTGLIRTDIGPHSLKQAVSVQQITPENIRELLRTDKL